MKKYLILIDHEFRSLIPPLSAEERAQLKQNINDHGLLDKIVVWGTPEGFVIVDGHHRYEILKELAQEEEEPDFDADEAFNTLKGEVNKAGWWNIVYGHETFRLERFEDREAVKLWILEHQVGRRNLSKQQRLEMVARIVVLRQEQTAKTSKANLKQGNKSPDVGKTPTSGKKTVSAAAKEFDVPEKPLQAAVNVAKGKPVAESNREKRRRAFVAKYPEFGGKPNKEIETQIRRHNFVLSVYPTPPEPKPDPSIALSKLYMLVDGLLPQDESTYSEACDSPERSFPSLINEAIRNIQPEFSWTRRTFGNNHNPIISMTRTATHLANVMDKAAAYLSRSANEVRKAASELVTKEEPT
jgi:hypothetical protein